MKLKPTSRFDGTHPLSPSLFRGKMEGGFLNNEKPLIRLKIAETINRDPNKKATKSFPGL